MNARIFTVVMAIANFTCPAWAAGKVEPGYYVAPNGKAAAAGTYEDPWDIVSALAGQQKAVQPGDTIWIRGGVYAQKAGASGERPQFTIKLAGTEQKPIVVRTAAGERAIIDGITSVAKGTDYLTLQDLEWCPTPGAKAVYETNQSGSWPGGLSPTGGDLRIDSGKGCKYVNLYIHDNPSGGSGFWVGATDSEMYGCIIVNNGWKGPDRHHGHAVYTQNNEGLKKITNCVLSTRNGDGQYTIHAYTEGGFLKNFDIEENICYAKGTFLVGGAKVAEHIKVRKNYLYNMPMQIKNGADCAIEDNVLLKSPLLVRKYQQATVNGNLIVGGEFKPELVEKLEGKNKTEAPAEPMVILQPNKFDTGRANLAIFNFPKAASVDVMNPEDLFGKPIFTGKVAGEKLTVPMKGDDFAVFIVFKGDEKTIPPMPATMPK
jgi:hypothetical protein